MKRLAIAAAAALTLVGPLAATEASAQPNRSDNHQRWDDQRYNGYYVAGRFYRGSPSLAMQRRNDFRPAWQNWRRGERLSAWQRSHYRQVDYRREHLRAPPRGYNYVRDDRGELLVVAVATGIIASIIASR